LPKTIFKYTLERGKNMDLQKAVLKIRKAQQGDSQYYLMPVQYNPSTLTYSSRAGLTEEQGAGDAGLKACRSRILPPETVLNVELFFTAAEESENTDFVQQRTEGLLSLVMQARSRQVVFAWGDMNFRGELEEASAEYTMFHAKGNPMMARVSLSIRQAGADSPAQTSKSEYQYWKKAWNKFQKFAEERDGVL